MCDIAGTSSPSVTYPGITGVLFSGQASETSRKIVVG